MPLTRSDPNRILFVAGILLTLLWLALFGLYIDTQIGWGNVQAMLPSEQGGLVAGLTAPLGFLWLFLAYLKRGADAKRHSEALQAELRKLSYPAKDAEGATKRLADALRKQVEVLNAASAEAQQQLTQTNAALEVQAQKIATLSEQIATKVGKAKETLAGETAALDDAGRRLEEGSKGFSRQAEAARQALGGPIGELKGLAALTSPRYCTVDAWFARNAVRFANV